MIGSLEKGRRGRSFFKEREMKDCDGNNSLCRVDLDLNILFMAEHTKGSGRAEKLCLAFSKTHTYTFVKLTMIIQSIIVKHIHTTPARNHM